MSILHLSTTTLFTLNRLKIVNSTPLRLLFLALVAGASVNFAFVAQTAPTTSL
jgi:hypothetical protein